MAKSYSITFCAILIIINCVWNFLYILNAQYYWYAFQYLPAPLILLRFILSWAGRVLLITAAVGLWQRKEGARKLAIILLIANIVSLPWKHPLRSFQYSYAYFHTHPEIAESIIRQSLGINIDLASLSHAFLIGWDLFFNGALLFFLTRGKIKNQFH